MMRWLPLAACLALSACGAQSLWTSTTRDSGQIADDLDLCRQQASGLAGPGLYNPPWADPPGYGSADWAFNHAKAMKIYQDATDACMRSKGYVFVER